MAKETILRGGLKLKEITLTESLTNRILSIASDGTVTDRPGIDLTTLLSTTLATGRVIIGNGSSIATAVDTASVGDIAADTTNGLTIKAGAILNVDVNGSAGIVYSKLNLANSIVGSDIAVGANIPYSKLLLTTSIVNGDIAVAAGIARSKTASGTAYRILANNATGVMSENASLSATTVPSTDANGQLVDSLVSTTRLNYSNTLTGNIQDQLDNEIATQTVTALVKAPGAGQDGFAITWDNAQAKWNLTDPVIQGIPVAGTTRQFLGKNSASNYDASWLSLVLTDISDVTALAADVNILTGAAAAGVDAGNVATLANVTSDIQTQFLNKLGTTLTTGTIFIGVGNVATESTDLPTGITIGTAYIYRNGGTDITLADGGTGASLADPGADRILFWDDSAGQVTWLTVGTGLSITGTTIDATGSGISGLTTNRIPYAASSTSLTDDSALTWDATNNAITINVGRVHSIGTQNMFVGQLSGNFTLTAINSFGAGYGTLQNLSSGNGNTAVGSQAGSAITTGTANTVVGVGAGNLITGSNNTCIGNSAGDNITSGSNNIIIGGVAIDAQSASASDQLSIQNAIFGSGNSATSTTISSGNLGLFATAWGTSASKVLAIGNGTGPTTSPADSVQLWAEDLSASSKLRLRDEAGNSGYVPVVLYGSSTLNFPSTAVGTNSDLTITVTGAALNDPVILGVPNGSIVVNSDYFAWVSAADTVTVRFSNYDLALSADPASGTFKATVVKQ